MNGKTVVFSLIALIVLFGGLYYFFGPKRPPIGPLVSKDNCSVASLDWMEVAERYDEKAVANLSATLEAAAKADASKLKGIAEGSGTGKLGSNFSTPAEYSSMKKAQVSQEFFEAAFAWRQAVCNLERQLTDKRISNPETLKLAEEQLIKLSAEFGRVKAKETLRSVTTDKASLSFGADGATQDLAIRSTLQQYADWSAEKPRFFDVVPINGTIKPGGSAAVRVQPKVSALSAGRNTEELWFAWKDENGESSRFSVTLTALRLPTLEYNVTAIDDQLLLKLNGVEIVRTKQANGWTPIPSPFRLNPGDNEVEVQIYNAATRSGNNPFGPREGWQYSLVLRIGQKELPLKDRSANEPPVEEWGATFTVKRINLVVDANSGDASFLER